jgi:D-xylose reductase
MEEVHAAGLAKNIGISNFSGGLLIDLFRSAKTKVSRAPSDFLWRSVSDRLSSAHQPSVLQIEHHPYLTQEPVVSLAKTLGLAITAYSSFGPQSFLELQHAGALETPSLLEHPTIAEIAKKHNKTSAQVLLRWSTQRGIAIIPKSTNPGRAKANLESVAFDLTEEDLKAISALNKGIR